MTIIIARGLIVKYEDFIFADDQVSFDCHDHLFRVFYQFNGGKKKECICSYIIDQARGPPAEDPSV